MQYCVFTFKVSSEEDRQNFIEDYRLTACISVLQWFCMEYKKHGVAGVEGTSEGQRTQVITFSIHAKGTQNQII